MRKGTRRTVLYDVLGKDKANRGQSALRVPDWGRRTVPIDETPITPMPLPAICADPAQDAAEAQPSPEPDAPITIRADGTWIITLSTVGKIVGAASLCALLLISFGLGRRNAGSPRNPTMTALAPDVDSTTGESDSPGGPAAPSNSAVGNEKNTQPLDELEQLLSPPTSVKSNNSGKPAAPRQTAKPRAAEPDRGRQDAARKPQPAASNDKARYLWIESITARGPAAMAQAEREANGIQAFLRQNGVETVIRKVNNGLKIFSAEGFADGAAGAADRDAFQRKIKELGRLYQTQGGRYLFKDCQFLK